MSERTPLRYIHVEDVETDAALIRRTLERNGYEPHGLRVQTADELAAALQQPGWDIILADWALPRFSAKEVLAQVAGRAEDLPVIIISGTVGEETAVNALKLGAHNYVMKHQLVRLAPAIQQALREVTERRARRQAEQSLRDREAQFRQLTNSLPQLVWTCTPDGACDFLSEQWLAYTGLPEAPQLGYGWMNQLHPDDRAAVTAAWQASVESGSDFQIEFRIRRHDGVYRLFDTRATRHSDSTGQHVKWFGSNTDITEQAQMEAALQENRALLHDVIESTPSFIFATDRQHRYILLNNALARFYGRPKEEILGKTHHDFLPGHIADSIRTVNEEIMATGKPCQIEEIVESTADSNPTILFTTKSALRDEQGTICGIVGSAIDISERKRMEAILKDTEMQLRHAQKMEAIGRLAGGVAHDFNNLLTVIMGYTSMLTNNQKVDASVRANLREIDKAAERATWLTRQLLAFSRRQILAPTVLDLNVLINNFEKILRRLIGEDIILEADLAPDLLRIKADPGQIEQVIMNLAVNARDAMPAGGHLKIATDTISVGPSNPAMFPAMPDGRYTRLRISDTGCGMDDETQKQIFDPFFTTKEEGKGTGLGLSTAYGIIKQSNGFIWVSSKVEQGTTFTLCLPAIDEPIVPTKKTTGQIPLAIGTETILLVEDAQPIRELMKIVLESSGYTVWAAANRAEAVKVAEERRWAFHLLLTDVIMPEGSGPDLADHLTARHPKLKVLYVSGYTDLQMAQQRILKSGHQLLQKPFVPTVLLTKVREVLDASQPKTT